MVSHGSLSSVLVESPTAGRPAGLDDGIYDYIIVGGGVSGSVLARRLSEDPQISVLLLEWGENHDEERCVKIYDQSLKNREDPMFAINYSCLANAQGADSRRLFYLQPRVLGGYSSLNQGLWARGGLGEWDEFADLAGNPGFSYYKMVDNWTGLEKFNGRSEKPLQRGHHGILEIMTPNNIHSEAGNRFAQTVRKILRVPIMEDFNNERPHGVARHQFALQYDPREGHLVRESLSSIMLPSSLIGVQHFAPLIRNRANLQVVTGALVDRLILEPLNPDIRTSLHCDNDHHQDDPQCHSAVFSTSSYSPRPSSMTGSNGSPATPTDEPQFKCQGVWYLHQGKVHHVMASTRVILCGGSASALILQRSGVGCEEILRSLGVPVKMNNPHVGGNLFTPYGLVLYLENPHQSHNNNTSQGAEVDGSFFLSNPINMNDDEDEDQWLGNEKEADGKACADSSSACPIMIKKVISQDSRARGWDSDPIGTYIESNDSFRTAHNSSSGQFGEEGSERNDFFDAPNHTDELSLPIDRWLGVAFSSDPTKQDRKQKGNPRRRWFFELHQGFLSGAEENAVCPPSNVNYNSSRTLALRLINMDPVTRGRMDICHSTASVLPRVSFNFYGDRQDLISNRELMKTGLRIAREMNLQVVWPRLSLEDCEHESELDWQLRSNLSWLDQSGGTCQVGRVVDGYLRVIGVEKLSVCDSSVFAFPMSPDQTGCVVGLAIQYAHFLSNHLDCKRCSCGTNGCGCCSVPCRVHPPAPVGTLPIPSLMNRVETPQRSNLWEVNPPPSSFSSPSHSSSPVPKKTTSPSSSASTKKNSIFPSCSTLGTPSSHVVVPRVLPRMSDTPSVWGSTTSPSFAQSCEKQLQRHNNSNSTIPPPTSSSGRPTRNTSGSSFACTSSSSIFSRTHDSLPI